MLHVTHIRALAIFGQVSYVDGPVSTLAFVLILGVFLFLYVIMLGARKVYASLLDSGHHDNSLKLQ